MVCMEDLFRKLPKAGKVMFGPHVLIPQQEGVIGRYQTIDDLSGVQEWNNFSKSLACSGSTFKTAILWRT